MIFKALASHYWRHPWQTLFLLLGLVAGVGLWSAVQIINQHARASYAEADSLLGAQAYYWIRSRADRGIAQNDYIRLRRAGFNQVFAVVEGEVSTTKAEPISIIAIDLISLPQNLFQNEADDVEDNFDRASASDWLAFIQSPYRAWVPQQLADELDLMPGERLLLRDGRQLPPAIIKSHTQQGRQILMDIGAAFNLLNTDRFSYLVVGQIDPETARQLEILLPAGYELIENQQQLDLSQLTESLHTHLTAMSLLSFAVGLFIVFNAVRFSLWYRRPTILNLRLMGVSSAVIAIAIFLETMVWSLVGAGLGFIVGLELSDWLLQGLSASLHSLYDATVEAEINWQPESLLLAWLITLGGLLWALAWPLFQQLKLNPVAANSDESLRLSERKARTRLLGAGLVLVVIAVLLYPRLDDAVSGFTLLGLMLFAAAWMLPGLLALALELLTRILPERSLKSRWLISDGWSQMPALRTAMMALLLAMTANLGVGTLVDSFRTAFTAWLEVRQSADIYVRSSRVDIPLLINSQSSSDWLLASHERIGITTRWQGKPTLIRGVDTNAPDSRQLPLSMWLTETAEAALAQWRNQPNVILANEQAHFLGGLELNDLVELESDTGIREYRVTGFFYDYGNPYFQFYLPRHEVINNWQYYYSRGLALWLKPDQTGSQKSFQIAEAKLRAAGARPGDWISQREVRQLSVNIFNRTFAITDAMNLLTLIVAGIALLASLLAILHERLPQFAQWQALGVNHKEQLLVIACPLLIFISVTWILAMPLGALLSWLLINKLNIVSFGWSMPMLWNFIPAIKLYALVIFITLLAIAVVTIQLRRLLPTALASLGEQV